MNLTTEFPVKWEASRYSVIVNCSADHVIVQKLVKSISRQLQKAGASDASISVSVVAENSAAGVNFQAK